MYSGFTRSEITEDMNEKATVLDWLVKNKIFDIDTCGYVISMYYKNKDKVMQFVKDNAPYSDDMFKV
jgi:hypothetical protein